MTSIYLVQHGIAASKDVDPERPLTAQGVQEVSAMARFLKQAGVQLSGIMHSGKLRAEQTAEILSRELLDGAATGIVKHINPNDPVPPFTTTLENYGNGTMFVGHLPFLEKLVAYLLYKSEAGTLVKFKPGSVVCLESEGGDWSIEWMIRPELIT